MYSKNIIIIEYDRRQITYEIFSAILILIWISIIFCIFSNDLVSKEVQDEISFNLIVGLISYILLFLISLLPDCINIVTNKKYNKINKFTIDSLTRLLFIRLKLLLLISLLFTTINKINNIEGYAFLFWIAIVLSFAKYIIDYRKI